MTGPSPSRNSKPLLCRLGIHTADRSQGVVGYCLRGCGDLKRLDRGRYIWTRYVEKPTGAPPRPRPDKLTS